MEEPIDSDDAKQALAAIGAQQARLVEEVLIPIWYWWLIALLTIPLGGAIDTHRSGLVVGVVLAYVIVVVAASLWLILGRRKARVSRELLGERGAVAIVVFVWLVDGVSIGAGFALRAGGVGHPALLGCTVCALGLVSMGPLLTKYLRRIMMKNRSVALP
ncbi:MAG: hypothetical protein WAK12_01315 [Acidimicrobiales bacterium]